ncbi:MAG: CAP domain-containing protein, partial [Deltaproteobacteria bacterium]|nr:CAP domain-containing protein [Deltaproteobacteria bacterium]
MAVLVRALAFLVFGVSTAAWAQAQRGVPRDGYPGWPERMLQVHFNRSRAAPGADPKACLQSAVRPPLADAWELDRAARFHSTNLARTGCFQHDSPCLLVPDLSTRWPPLGTCDGSAACACTNAPRCLSDCPSSQCTQTFDRMGLFGISGTGEIIAKGQASPRAAHRAWMMSPGHCAIILGSASRVGTGWYENHWTGNFASGALATGPVAGGHEVGASFGQFLSAGPQPVEFRLNHHDPAGAPRNVTVNVAGTCTALQLERGSGTNGTWLTTLSLAGPACRRYAFVVEDAAGAARTLPERGSYGLGTTAAGCLDWEPSTPPPCGQTSSPGEPDAGSPAPEVDAGTEPPGAETAPGPGTGPPGEARGGCSAAGPAA